MVIRRASRIAAGALLALGGIAACSNNSNTPAGADPAKIDVVVAFYPLQFVAERVGGDAVQVTNLAKPGAEPHDLELNPGQVGQISKAKLVVYLKSFQPAVDDAVAQQGGDRAFDVTGAAPLLDAATGGPNHAGEPGAAPGAAKDPHVWLDPTRLSTIGDKLAERLGKADPARAADYTARAKTLRGDLETLDKEFDQGLTTCQRREVVTSHAAFGYLADRYKLTQIGLTGLTPEDEPSPQRLADVAKTAKDHKATTIFFETLVSPKVAETIAKEIGAKTAVLDPIEGLEPGSTGDYLSVMRSNLSTLKTALSCS
jgi:zinc transport system substrate-binding protein